MTSAARSDTETDRQLQLLVGLVAVCAAISGFASLYLVSGAMARTPDELARAATLVFLAAVGVTVKWLSLIHI